VTPGSYELAWKTIQAGGWGTWTWVAQADACDDCADMDGEEFDEEPERLHPNCKCELEYKIHAEHHEKWHKMKVARHRASGPKTGRLPKKVHAHRKKNPKLWTNPKKGMRKKR